MNRREIENLVDVMIGTLSAFANCRDDLCETILNRLWERSGNRDSIDQVEISTVANLHRLARHVEDAADRHVQIEYSQPGGTEDRAAGPAHDKNRNRYALRGSDAARLILAANETNRSAAKAGQ